MSGRRALVVAPSLRAVSWDEALAIDVSRAPHVPSVSA